VHAPVADNALLISAGSHLMRLVTGPERWERFVWTITHSPNLRQHPMHGGAASWPIALDVEGLVAQAFFRTERQTFIPMPSRRQAIFTIHVEMHPLYTAMAEPANARLVHDALASMSPAVLAYRGLTDVRLRLLQWLSKRAAGTDLKVGAPE
jgi:hypothetical protein